MNQANFKVGCVPLETGTTISHNNKDAIARIYRSYRKMPILITYGNWCNYFNILRVKMPFEKGGKWHAGYSDYDYNLPGCEELYAGLAEKYFFQLHFWPLQLAKLNGSVVLPQNPKLQVVAYGPFDAEEERVAKKGYAILLAARKNAGSTIITGDDCRKQLEAWGIKEKCLDGLLRGY